MRNKMERIAVMVKLKLKCLISPRPCRSLLRPTLAAVNWPAWIRLERNFTFLTTLRASCLMHLSSCHTKFQLLTLSLTGTRIKFLRTEPMHINDGYKTYHHTLPHRLA